MVDSAWNQLLENVREASLDGLSWHAVTRSVSIAFDAPAVAFYGQSNDAASFKETAIVGIGDPYIEAYRHHYSQRDNPWVRAGAFWRPGVIRTERALQQITGDRRILRRSGYYRDWIRPQGFGHAMSVVVDRDDDGYLKLALYRGADQPDFSNSDQKRFAVLCQQMHQLLDLAPRYQLARTLAALSLRALDGLEFGVVLLSLQGGVLEMNQAARALLQDGVGLEIRDDRLRGATPAADRRLRALLEAPIASMARRRDLRLRPPDVAVPVTLSAVLATPRFGTAGLLLFVSCPTRTFDQRLHQLVERYRLTSVELMLCRGLLEGCSLREAGTRAGLSYETARWYLKQVFAKTDTHRQADLVRVLLSVTTEVALPPPM